MSLTYYTMCQQESQVKDMNVSRYSRKNKKAVADSPTTAFLFYIRILFLQFQLIHCQFQRTHNSLIIIQAWQYNIIIQIIHLFRLNITGHLFSYFFSD